MPTVPFRIISSVIGSVVGSPPPCSACHRARAAGACRMTDGLRDTHLFPRCWKFKSRTRKTLPRVPWAMGRARGAGQQRRRLPVNMCAMKGGRIARRNPGTNPWWASSGLTFQMAACCRQTLPSPPLAHFSHPIHARLRESQLVNNHIAAVSGAALRPGYIRVGEIFQSDALLERGEVVAVF